jgi:hypothetical protein
MTKEFSDRSVIPTCGSVMRVPGVEIGIGLLHRVFFDFPVCQPVFTI